ncbi:MAG: DUF4358 domain-containing protein [Lachnospiraceae bacterium]|nr:DUF4358 domain-containing protein [Lachnospiraceae bacterium]
MKRTILLILVAAMVLGLCACGSKPEVPVADVYERMAKEVKFPTEMLKMDDSIIIRDFGFDLDTFEEYLYMKAEDVLFAENIMLIKVKDAKDVDAVKEKLEKFVKEQATLLNGYMPDQGKIAEKGIVVAKGRYVYLLMSSEVNALKKIAAEMI